MLAFVVPHSIYPDWYHCDKTKCLPFISLAWQKNYISFYHMWFYSSTWLVDWFTSEYQKVSSKKIDMWKVCVKFKKWQDIPFELIGDLCKKITVPQWIEIYETNIARKK
jgi:hypothetical protein